MFNKKIALVIGASQGIGKSTALSLAKKGYSLILNARRSEKLEEVLLEINGITNLNHSIFTGDITNKETRKNLFIFIENKYRQLDILINNIPGGAPDNFLEFNEESTLKAFSQKALTYIDCIKEATFLMKNNQYGRVISLVGNLGKEPTNNMFTNSLINAAIINASKNISSQLASENITVNCVNPGFIKTDRYYTYIDSLVNNRKISKREAEEQVASGIPANRVGSSEEVASLITYLCSEDAAYITGQQISVDGGALISL